MLAALTICAFVAFASPAQQGDQVPKNPTPTPAAKTVKVGDHATIALPQGTCRTRTRAASTSMNCCRR